MDVGLDVTDSTSFVFWFTISTFFAIIAVSGEAMAADTCNFQQGVTSVVAYCEDGCCDDGCCSSSKSSVDSTLVIIIIGVIVGVVVMVLIIIAIVCCLKEKKGEKPAQTSEMELTERPNGAVPTGDILKPKTRKKNAVMAMNGHIRHPHRKSVTKETTFLTDEVASSHQISRRQLGSRRTSKIRPSDVVLPQVEEVEEPY